MNYEHAWLTYKKIASYLDKDYFKYIYINGENPVMQTAVNELSKAAEEILDIKAEVKYFSEEDQPTRGIVLKLDKKEKAGEEGYRIIEKENVITISSVGTQGILYGSYELIRKLQMEDNLKGYEILSTPSNPIRILNHWDNMDGSIERGYSGQSFFFKGNEIIVDDRTREYARLVASIGINGVVINNVNVKECATKLIDEVYSDKLKEMAEIFSEYGIKLYLSLNFAAPLELGALETADPLDENVKAWWSKKMSEVFTRIPNLGGFLVKADSEGRPGPFTYNRTHADGANMLAETVAPYNGLIIWRCFVYNCQQDWRDYKTDRARSGYDHFKPLDGEFRDNVILQIKNGPMDFQVREPIHPLLGGMQKTNQILEVQIAQEYTGQQKHVCYLIPMFKQILEFKTYCQDKRDTVADLISGTTYGHVNCGMAAVTNTGDDENWTGHDLAAANLFGFGRLSFNTSLSAEEIAKEWIKCTFGCNQKVVDILLNILMRSWPTYEKYTSPLGIGWMINPNHHYGPNVDGYEYDRWGTYHRADHKGIGVDRTTKGTGYIAQYNAPNSSNYNSIETCPEELLLFFHHVPYTYCLKTGKTLIQHIYDTHFEGAEEAWQMVQDWKQLEGLIPDKCFARTLERLQHQEVHSKEWRDQINSYFYRKSNIPDQKERVIY